ncbi:MAG: hypothetical protein WAL92_01915 [Thiogranum sp.]
MTARTVCMQPAIRRVVGYHQIGAMMTMAVLVIALLLLSGCASMGFREPAAVTVPQIIKMSREGTPATAIIERMRRSGTVYRLKASQLDELHQQGVSDSVINYMQRTYLEAVHHRAERQDWSYWNEDDGWWYGGAPWGWSDDEGDDDD